MWIIHTLYIVCVSWGLSVFESFSFYNLRYFVSLLEGIFMNKYEACNYSLIKSDLIRSHALLLLLLAHSVQSPGVRFIHFSLVWDSFHVSCPCVVALICRFVEVNCQKYTDSSLFHSHKGHLFVIPIPNKVLKQYVLLTSRHMDSACFNLYWLCLE